MSGAMGANADTPSGGAAPQTGGNDRLNAVKGKAGAALKKLGGLARVGGNAVYRRGTQFLDQILMNRFGSASAKGRYTIQLVAHDMLKRWLAYSQMSQPGKNWRVEQGAATPRAILQFIHDTYGADPRAVTGAIRMMKSNGMLPQDFDFETLDGRKWGGGDPDEATPPSSQQGVASPTATPSDNAMSPAEAAKIIARVSQKATRLPQEEHENSEVVVRQWSRNIRTLRAAVEAMPDEGEQMIANMKVAARRMSDAPKQGSLKDMVAAQLRDLILSLEQGEPAPQAPQGDAEAEATAALRQSNSTPPPDNEAPRTHIPSNGFAGAVNNALTALLQASPQERVAQVKKIKELLIWAKREDRKSFAQIKKNIASIYRDPQARAKAPEAVAALGKMLGATNESVTILTLALLEDAHRGTLREGWRRIIREATDADVRIDRQKLMQFFLQLSWAFVKSNIVRVKLPGDSENSEAPAGGGSGGMGYGGGGGAGRGNDQDRDDAPPAKKNSRALETAMNQSNFNYQGRNNFDSLIQQARRDNSYTDFKANASSFINQTDTQEILGKDDPLRAMFMTVKAMQ